MLCYDLPNLGGRLPTPRDKSDLPAGAIGAKSFVASPAPRGQARFGLISALLHAIALGCLIGLVRTYPPPAPVDEPAIEVVFESASESPAPKPESEPTAEAPLPPHVETPEALPASPAREEIELRPPTPVTEPELEPRELPPPALTLPEPPLPTVLLPEPPPPPLPRLPPVVLQPIRPPPKPVVKPPPAKLPPVQAVPHEPAIATPRPAAPPVTAQPSVTAQRPVATQTPAVPAAVDGAWQASVADWLARRQTYPEEARRQGEEGLVRVRFTVDRTGHVIEAEIVGRSGSERLDAAAIVLLRTATLPAFPPKMPQARITITTSIRYTLLSR